MKLVPCTRKLLAAVLTTAAVASTAPEVKALTVAESNFLSDVFYGLVNNGYGQVATELDPNNLLRAVYLSCDGLNVGISLDQLLQEAASAVTDNVSASNQYAANFVMGYTIASGIQHFCPQHYYQVQALGDEPTYYTPATLAQPSWNGGSWATLTASDRSSQINIRSTPSLTASAPHYGVVGDRVWITAVERVDGHDWYFVGFPGSGATGWVRGDFVDFD